MLRIKSFIYRLSAVFGLRIYLAKKEEDEFLRKALFANKVLGMIDEKEKEIHLGILSAYVGMWHAEHGFTSVYTRGMNPFEALKQRTIHLFKG